MTIRNRHVARWLPRWFPIERHPFIVFEQRIESRLNPRTVFLDAGCGHTADLARRFRPLTWTAIGLDVTDFDTRSGDGNIDLVQGALTAMPLAANSVDVVAARAVVEHLEDPSSVFGEVCRVLKPGGRFLFLTPNAYHYASVLARLIPNRYHGAIVSSVEHRAERDTFPVHFRANTVVKVRQYAQAAGLEVVSADFAGQYPGYLVFSFPLFAVGSLYEKAVEKVHALRWMRRWLLIELQKQTRCVETAGP